MDEGAIACIYRSEASLGVAAAQLFGLGLRASALHLGASDPQRAQGAAERIGISADVHPDDPLQDLVSPTQDGGARGAIDRAGMVGAGLGALIGIALSFTPVGALVAAPHAASQLANAGFYAVLGAIVGSVLGAALGPQQSTHAGFRLIDGMQEGAYALIVVAPRARLDELQHVLESTGGTGITRV